MSLETYDEIIRQKKFQEYIPKPTQIQSTKEGDEAVEAAMKKYDDQANEIYKGKEICKLVDISDALQKAPENELDEMQRQFSAEEDTDTEDEEEEKKASKSYNTNFQNGLALKCYQEAATADGSRAVKGANHGNSPYWSGPRVFQQVGVRNYVTSYRFKPDSSINNGRYEGPNNHSL